MTDNNKSEIFHATLDAMLQKLLRMLQEAQEYLDHGKDRAAPHLDR